MDRIIKHLCVFVRAALRRRSIFCLNASTKTPDSGVNP